MLQHHDIIVLKKILIFRTIRNNVGTQAYICFEKCICGYRIFFKILPRNSLSNIQIFNNNNINMMIFLKFECKTFKTTMSVKSFEQII